MVISNPFRATAITGRWWWKELRGKQDPISRKHHYQPRYYTADCDSLTWDWIGWTHSRETGSAV